MVLYWYHPFWLDSSLVFVYHLLVAVFPLSSIDSFQLLYMPDVSSPHDDQIWLCLILCCWPHCFGRDKDDLGYMIRKLQEEWTETGLSINMAQCEYIIVGSKQDLTLDAGQIRGVERNKYLGVFFNKLVIVMMKYMKG